MVGRLATRGPLIAVIGGLTALSGAALAGRLDTHVIPPSSPAPVCPVAASLYGSMPRAALFIDRHSCRWIGIVLR